MEADPTNSWDDGLDQETFDAQAASINEAGYEVVTGGPNILLLDLDTIEQEAQFQRVKHKVDYLFKIDEQEDWKSKSGSHIHVRLTTEIPLSVHERIIVQLCLGSDPFLGLLQMARLRAGVVEPCRLFKPVSVSEFADKDF